jgi:hypothetical protein
VFTDNVWTSAFNSKEDGLGWIWCSNIKIKEKVNKNVWRTPEKINVDNQAVGEMGWNSDQFLAVNNNIKLKFICQVIFNLFYENRIKSNRISITINLKHTS